MDDPAKLVAELRERARRLHGGTSYTSALLIRAADEIERVLNASRDTGRAPLRGKPHEKA